MLHWRHLGTCQDTIHDRDLAVVTGLVFVGLHAPSLPDGYAKCPSLKVLVCNAAPTYRPFPSAISSLPLPLLLDSRYIQLPIIAGKTYHASTQKASWRF